MILAFALLALGQADAGLLEPPMVQSVEAETQTTEDTTGAPATPAAERVRQVARVTLRGGQVLEGWLESRDETGLTLSIGGQPLLLSAKMIERVDLDGSAYETSSGSIYFRDPNRTRYLYSPSAMMLKKGEFSFSQVELVLTTFTYGLTDWLTVQAGTALPVWFVPPFPTGLNFVVGAKAGGQLSERFHLAGGFQTLFVPGVGSAAGGFPLVGIGFVTATYGNPDAHVSLSAGLPFSAVNAFGFAAPAVSISGNYRVARTVALVSENWLVFYGPQGSRSFTLVDSIAARAMGENIAVDVGLVTLFNGDGAVVPFPIPWLTFTYNFK